MKESIFKNKKSLPAGRQGFTLMEVIVAVAIIITALIACISLITSSISSIKGNKLKIIATGLAQEGLEIVRNIRDNNWLNYKRKAEDWRDGLSAGDYLVEFNRESLLPFVSTPLRIKPNERYQYYEGDNTPFYRKITIQDIDTSQFKVIAEVSWQEGQRNNLVRAETRFYNWLEEE